ncbi:MAG: hypothetical protein H6727_11000 [Myxococcales bacterium]|nr:hypothetical protein [Myxococcales bacterium]
MKKWLASLFAGTLLLTSQLASANADELGFKYKPQSQTKCSTNCSKSCKTFFGKKCSKQLQWHTQCKTYRTWQTQCKDYTKWETQCKNFKRLRASCSANKRCYQKCVRYINNEKEYTKCYGKMRCKYKRSCRPYWQSHQRCYKVPTKYTKCTRKPTNYTRCHKHPTWSTVCRKRPVFRRECEKVPSTYVKCHTTWKTTHR